MDNIETVKEQLAKDKLERVHKQIYSLLTTKETLEKQLAKCNEQLEELKNCSELPDSYTQSVIGSSIVRTVSTSTGSPISYK